MLKLVGKVENDIPLYEDEYMEDNTVWRGRKQGIEGPTFFVANPKTANMLYKQFQKKLRKEKLNRISQ